MTAAQLLARYKPLAGTRLNFVTTPTLAFTGAGSTSDGLSNESDRALLRHLRAMSDLIITDAATASAEDYRPSKLAMIEVWSRSANFGELSNVSAKPPYLAMNLQKVSNIAHRLDELSKSHHSILFESGPTLSKALGELKVIDELCLTITNAADESTAIQAGRQWANKHSFGYLTMHDCFTTDSTYFIRLGR